MTPRTSVRGALPPVSPQSGAVDSLRWRGFRQSGPFLSLLESVLVDVLQVITASKALHPFRPATTLLNVPARGTDLSLIAVSAQTYAIQIESLRAQILFRLSSPPNG